MHIFRTLKILIILLVVVGAISSSVWAQQQAGAAIQEIHRRSNPNHPGYSQPAPPREIWQDKYGAIAADWSDNGGVGIAEDENSMRAARRVAMQRCGTPRCKVVATATNFCLQPYMVLGGVL